MHRTVVYDLAKFLALKKNYQIIILQPCRSRELPKRKDSEGVVNNIKVVFFPTIFMKNISYSIPLFDKEFKVLCELVYNEGCQIVQACNYDYLTSVPPIFLKRRQGIPLTITCDALPGYSWFYGEAVVDAVAKLYTHSIGKWILSSYDEVILLSKRASEEVENFGVPHGKISVIPNGVNLEDFKRHAETEDLRADLAIKRGNKVLLFVGRLAKVKRLDVLLALTKSLLKEGIPVRTVIVGDGPEKQYYEKLAEPIKDNVNFVGFIPHNQLPKYYLLADVFILPSLSEGLPTVLLEAAAAEKPCVATNVYGVPDIIQHGETGFLVGRTRIDLYSHFVRILLKDEDLARTMGKKAREHVKQNFNWDAIVDDYEKVYRRLLNV